MKVLVHIDPHTREQNMTQDELAVQTFNLLSTIYNDEARLSDSYLLPPDDTKMAAQWLEFTDGKLFPNIIQHTAKNWNRVIEDNFTNALKKLQSCVQPGEDGHCDWCSAPSGVIYEMKKAAMALDGDFYEFAENAVVINEHMSLGTYIQDHELKDIMEHPENYAILQVSPK